MDFKVDVGNVLKGSHPATDNAARWLRRHFKILDATPIFDKFEEYFDCRIDVDDRTDWYMEPNMIVFETSADLTAFLLRWS